MGRAWSDVFGYSGFSLLNPPGPAAEDELGGEGKRVQKAIEIQHLLYYPPSLRAVVGKAFVKLQQSVTYKSSLANRIY